MEVRTADRILVRREVEGAGAVVRAIPLVRVLALCRREIAVLIHDGREIEKLEGGQSVLLYLIRHMNDWRQHRHHWG